MPIYEYSCRACQAPHEAKQRMTDAPLTTCPACGAPELERVVSLPTFTLEGSGWYRDGYGSAGAAPLPAKPKPGSS